MRGERSEAALVHQHADVHHAVAFEHAGRGLAEHRGVHGGGDVVGGEAEALRIGVAHAQD